MDIKLLGSGKYEYRLIGPTEQELQQLTQRRQGGKQAHKIIVWDLESDKPAEGMRQQMGTAVGNKISPIVVAAGGGFASVTDKPTLYMAKGSTPIPKQIFFDGDSLDPNNLPVGLSQTDDVKRTLTAFMNPLGAPQQFIDGRIVKNGVAPDTEQPQATPPAQQPAQSNAAGFVDARVTASASKHYTFESSPGGMLIMRNGGSNAGIVYPNDPNYRNPAMDGKQGGTQGEMALMQYNGNPKGIFETKAGPVKIAFPAGSTIDLNVIDPKTGKPVADQEQFRAILSRFEPVGQNLVITQNQALQGGAPAVANAPAVAGTPTMPEPAKPETAGVDPNIKALRDALSAFTTAVGGEDAKNRFLDGHNRNTKQPDKNFGKRFRDLEALAKLDKWSGSDIEAAQGHMHQIKRNFNDYFYPERNTDKQKGYKEQIEAIQESGALYKLQQAVDGIKPTASISTPEAGAAVAEATSPANKHPFEALVAAHSEPKFPVSEASNGLSSIPGGRGGNAMSV